MEVAAFIVSVVAVIVAGGALMFTIRADKRARAQEQRAIAQEERDQRRALREAAEARTRREARPSAAYLGRLGSGSSRAYRFRVTNIGRESAATDLKAWLIDSEGSLVSEDLGYLAAGSGLLQVGESTEFAIPVHDESRDRNPLFLKFTWIDNRDGERAERVSGVEVPAE
jgi:hypothetical protein